MRLPLTFKIYSRHCCLLMLLFFIVFPVFAQLKANFTVDKTGGCSPLTVSFTNTTTGASSAATYKWDFGNGNTSALVSPGATYVTEKTYTVTLTVTDGSNTSAQTEQITVYKKPTVDFSALPVKGCVPLPVNFTSTATAGDGSIASYFWDFGDGNTQQGVSLQQISHTYNFAQNPTVQLTVTNSEGCYNSMSRSMVQVLPAINATFNSDSILCNLTDAANFINTSTGPGPLSYTWDFGDGNTSTAASPSHLYQTKGTYTVKLQVSNADGCTASTQAGINVANISTDFDIPPLVCVNTIVPFTDKSSKMPTTTLWNFDGNPYIYSYPGGTAYNGYYSAGIHTVSLTNTYGTCQQTVTKQFSVEDVPPLKGFVASFGACGAPITVNFKDTTQGDVQWLWSLANGTSSTLQSPSATYTYNDNFQVGLLVTNKEGCTSSIVQTVIISNPNVYISVIQSVGGTSTNVGCEGLTITFGATPANIVTGYKWNFGDGSSISTAAQPVHTYNQAGNYTVQLVYTTSTGCTDSTTYPYIVVNARPKVDFTSLSGTTICGNTPVTFSPILQSGNTQYWTWNFGDGQTGYDPNYTTISHKYDSAGFFTVTFIAYNYGCSDTVVKTNYIKVSPPFPHISAVINTCADTRAAVAFTQDSKQALTWNWDFGDGAALSLNTNQDTVRHTYSKTGAYKVILTTTNGQCTVKDSVEAYVLLKQHPILTGDKTVMCENDALNMTVTNLQLDPQDSLNHFDSYDYSISQFQYGDGTTAISYYGGSYTSNFFSGISLSSLQAGKDSLRVIIYSTMRGCYDTSNYIPIKIKGPVGGFEIPNQTPCLNTPAIIIDTSKASWGVPIKTWQWNFGDGTTETDTTGGTIKHIYTNPGTYYNIWLSVTDQDGCISNVYPDYIHFIQINGPKAAFTYSPAIVSPNTTVSFSNTTDNTNSYNTQYLWIFGDGTTSTDYAPSHTYIAEQQDTVKLIAINPTTNCADTAIQVIGVKKIHASFTYSTSYINNNSCPPVIVHFVNTSVNTSTVSWNFGDGNGADNQNNPSHTYNASGIYKITLYSYGINNQVDSVTDSITVKGPYAILTADVLSGCLAQTVTLSAKVRNASSFTWDFADGTLLQTTDTFAVHAYLTPGLYTPSMILKDNGGCSSTSSLGDTIVIDTLNIAIKKSTGLVCDSAVVSFNPDIYSLASDQMHRPLQYKWDFGTGKAADTSSLRTPLFDYNLPGKYIIHLQVQSPYGCIKQATDSLIVVARSKAAITALPEVCPGIAVSFAGTATITSTTTAWNWDFKNGDQSALQNPLAERFTDSGTYTIQLVVANAGCLDTAYHNLIVDPKPIINVSPKQALVCLGKSVQLIAGGGNIYVWTPAQGLNDYTIDAPVASPSQTTTYTVQVTNSFGCRNMDSAVVTVAGPFNMTIPADTFLCSGSSVQLYANGAQTYQWINTTAGLSNTQIANPVATPQTQTAYTVVGYDAYGCFTDTAVVHIDIKPLPTVNAGPDIETLTGSTVQLNATGSSDVLQWNWIPADYLSCSDCASPVSEPRNDISYIVIGKTQFGCAASDTLNIKLICAQDRVYIPDAFSPNNDGTNDVFYIKGRGIKIIRSLRIFSRWGEMVFERKGININDRSAAWDGNFKGSPVATGTYVYIAEMICDTGETFALKGTVIIIR